MTTETKKRVTKSIFITSVAETVSPQGNPQWELYYADPFSNKGFPTKGWLDASERKPSLGVHTALLEQQRLKPDRDGSLDWHWYWRLIQLDVPAVPELPRAPMSQGASAPSAPGYTDVQERMDRRTALMQAVEFAKSDTMNVRDTLGIADAFYAWLRGQETPQNENPGAGEPPDLYEPGAPDSEDEPW